MLWMRALNSTRLDWGLQLDALSTVDICQESGPSFDTWSTPVFSGGRELKATHF